MKAIVLNSPRHATVVNWAIAVQSPLSVAKAKAAHDLTFFQSTLMTLIVRLIIVHV